MAPSRMVGVSAAVNLPLHHKVQKFSSNTSSPGWSQKKGRKTVVVCGGGVSYYWTTNNFTKRWLISSVCNKHHVLSVFSATDGHTVAVRNVIVLVIVIVIVNLKLRTKYDQPLITH